MKKHLWIAPAAVGALFLFGCNTVDNSLGDKVFTCDATATVAEMCIEDAGTDQNLEPSKSTCKDVKGSWSDTQRCPTDYKLKCKESGKITYFYAAGDEKTTCTDHGVGVLLSSQAYPF